MAFPVHNKAEQSKQALKDVLSPREEDFDEVAFDDVGEDDDG